MSCANFASNKRPLWREVVVLLSVSVAVAAGAFMLHPRVAAIATVAEIEIGQVTGPDWFWVDDRGSAAYEAGHVPLAIHVGEGELEVGLQRLLAVWSSRKSIVVYCDSQKCDSARVVAAHLGKALGTEKIYVLKGGWKAWTEKTVR